MILYITIVTEAGHALETHWVASPPWSSNFFKKKKTNAKKREDDERDSDPVIGSDRG